MRQIEEYRNDPVAFLGDLGVMAGIDRFRRARAFMLATVDTRAQLLRTGILTAADERRIYGLRPTTYHFDEATFDSTKYSFRRKASRGWRRHVRREKARARCSR